MKEDRAVTLLKATYAMLKKIEHSPFVLSPFETTVHYDEADCDGWCLMTDLEDWLRETGIDLPEEDA